MTEPEKTRRKLEGRFEKGCSGNPAGRPKGAVNCTTMAAQELLSGEAQRLTRKAVELALEGNLGALRLCLDRILPIRRGPPLQIDLGPVSDPSQLQQAFEHLIEAMGQGRINASEVASITAPTPEVCG